MQKTVEAKYRKLSEVEHCLSRPGRYIGSITPHTSVEWVLNSEKKMEQREITFNPGFLKIFDEIITNSADHSKTPEGKHLDVIRIDVDQVTGEISCYDNGGIPVAKHADYEQWVPEMIFDLRAGSNFDDDDQAELAGQNGEGAALTCIFSERFTVETCDSKHRFKMTFTDNSQTRPEPKITKVEDQKGYTKITYKPEFHRLGMTAIDDANFEMLRARTVEIAATNTHLKVYFNQERILTRTFKEYIELFTDQVDQLAYDDNTAFRVGVIRSEESGFQCTSYVNGTKTKNGGTHVAYVVNQIVEALRVIFRKKHKVEVKPADIRNHLHLFIDCNIINPRYTSQTKDELITEPSNYGKSWSVPDKFIQKLLKTEIIQSILDWVEAKANAELARELRKANKDQNKADPRKIDKFSDASERTQRHRCVLFLAEGDSAAKSIQGGRGKNPYIGAFPLKGKPLNVREKEISRVLGLDKKKEGKSEPNEIQKILTIIGLQIGVPVTSLADLRFGKLAVASDADTDGAHICGLLMNMIDHFWPELFKMGFVHILRTPVIVVTLKDKSTLEFFTEREYRTWEGKEGAKLKGWSMKYYKGLASWKTPQFAHFLSNLDRYLFKITMPDQVDKNAIDLAFNSQRADDRKVWLETPAADFDDFILREAS